ncbi:MAG: type II secretion system GspH family protein [Candidatus Dormibacteraeota bacterium]|nr:type II secretion system GspH family protein [Candidatus Dormibacteraeota bacterium]
MRSRSERRRRAQAGTTLIELLVSLMIIGLAVLVLVGSLSTGVLDATLAKRNTAANAAIEYEVEKIGAASYTSPPEPYSECFAIDTAVSPMNAAGGQCPAGTNLRADVTGSAVQAGVQQWTVQVRNYPSLDALGANVSVYKVDR